MMLNKVLILSIITGFSIFLSCTKKVEEYSASKLQNDIIYQYSTRELLFNRKYDGKLNLAKMRTRGNFGLGTFNALDGELICDEGGFFKIRGDGKIIEADYEEMTPFVTLKFFQIDTSIVLNNNLSLQETYLEIAKNINEELMAAVRITGKFKYLKGRSVDKQTVPYPPINEVAANQNIFEFHDVEGTLIGFKFPESMSDINFAGFHFHFASEDRDVGGHVLDFESEHIKVDIDFCSELRIELIGE